MIRIDLQLGGGDRVIDPIVNVKRGNIPVAHPAAAHIRFIRKNQRRRQRTDRHTGALIMIADGSRDMGDLLRRKAHFIQQPERHHSAALAVIHPIHQIADVMKISGDAGQLHQPGRIS